MSYRALYCARKDVFRDPVEKFFRGVNKKTYGMEHGKADRVNPMTLLQEFEKHGTHTFASLCLFFLLLLSSLPLLRRFNCASACLLIFLWAFAEHSGKLEALNQCFWPTDL